MLRLSGLVLVLSLVACGDNRTENFAPTLDHAGGGSITLKTSEDASVTIDARATDREGDPLTYTIAKAPDHGTLVAAADEGVFTYTPTARYSGMDTMAIAISDGTHTITVPVGVRVAAVNHAPEGKLIGFSPLPPSRNSKSIGYE